MKIISLKDIESLVQNKIEESLTLDYKRAVSSNDEIAKDISSFANASGGTIIYGIEDKDRKPQRIVWVDTSGVEEKFQNIAQSAVQPPLEITVTRLVNPDDETKSIYIINIPQSTKAPHMAKDRYYRRNGSISTPMNNDEVKRAMLGVGRINSLRFELNQNLDLEVKTRGVIEKLYTFPPGKRDPVAFLPLYTDVWDNIVASGLLFSIEEELVEQLVTLYKIIHEVNSLIQWYNMHEVFRHEASVQSDVQACVFTPADPSPSNVGRYLPRVIMDKLLKLDSVLTQALRAIPH